MSTPTMAYLALETASSSFAHIASTFPKIFAPQL